ncbi:MAG TPA: potassium-transporting ATPase subunit KdpA [Tepidisphaeraceae bacterium]|nr:potassium-transporting ATPase subunit KdpA [Tepidisphaeraceae bacterium]
MSYMRGVDWLQLIVFCIGLFLITKPMGIYLLHVLDPDQEGGMGILERILGPVEWLVYKVARIDPKKQQNWKQYTLSLLMLGMVTMLLSYGLYRIQDLLPLKQNMANLGQTVDKNDVINGGGKVPGIIAFIQAASFVTNTDWQSYEPEQMFTHFSQTVSTALHFFFSSEVGIAAAAVMVRAVSRKQTTLIGNFWVDLTRQTLYLFLPICVVFALLDCWQGIPMNFRPYTQAMAVDQSGAASTTQPVIQGIVQGPMASYCAPKVLGLNGPGFTGVDCCHPFENPTPLSEFLQWMLYFSVIAGLPYYYGRMIHNRLHAWNIWIAMFVMLLGTLFVTWYFEAQPNPNLVALGIDPSYANMEGKDVRIGIYNSAAWANDVTDTAEGANNCQHDSMTPMADFMLLFNMHMGEVIFGGIGSGMYTMLVFIFVSVFLAGLMIGRTPEYLGKKIDSYGVKCCCLYLLLLVIDAVGFTAWGSVANWGQANVGNGGPHGFSEIFYAFSSGMANNGTSMGGYTCSPTTTNAAGQTVYASTTFNWAQTYCMLLGRYWELIPILALAGGVAAKKTAPSSAGSFPVVGPTFIILIIAVIVIVGALNFLPGLAMGPLLEHFIMRSGGILY